MAESKSRQSVKSVSRPGSNLPAEPPTVSQRILASGQSTAGQSARQLPADGQDERTGEPVLAQRYRLLEKLGAGAMGTVYKAEDDKLGRTVAIKILPERSTPDPEAVARFQREARALAKLSHPAIVQAFDEDEDQGRHFLVMEFVAGQNLAAVLKDQGSLPPTRAAAYAHQVALGLAHAHERGLVHRDLKPGNLLLTPEGDVKILDLGLARFLQDQIGDATLTLEGSGVGTPDYMAPEQFTSARHVDRRADIYSLGCTLYHLIAGRVPFPTSSLTEKYKSHEQHDPPPLETLCPDVPAGLALAVGRMMAKRPEDRFQSAAEAAEALAPYVAGSSQSFHRFKATASWHGSQLGISVVPNKRERRQKMIVGCSLTATVASLSVLVVMWLGGMLNRPDDSIAQLPGAAPGQPSNPPGSKSTASIPADPNVLTVAQDGRGEFTTIADALRRAKPGMTIRLLDDAVYGERILLNLPRYAGLTIDAPHGAALQVAGTQVVLVTISNVPRVTLRGLKLRGGGPRQTLVIAHGDSHQLVLDGLALDPGTQTDTDGVFLIGLKGDADQPPSVVQNCRFERLQIAVHVRGSGLDGQTPDLCERVVVKNCSISDGLVKGIVVARKVSQVQILGNRLEGGATYAGIEFEHLVNPADVLVANNTFLGIPTAIKLWDKDVSGERMELAGNLNLGAAGMDWLFMDSGGQLVEALGPGDGKLVTDRWKLVANWREVAEPQGLPEEIKGWIPPGKEDVRQDRIAGISRDPDQRDFLRPAADSPLATGGAGGDLPPYVGAVAPNGSEPWDWTTTWNSRHPDRVLTVSQKPEDGGKFRTLGEALLKAGPGMTIRLLDDGTYPETLTIDNRVGQAGLTIDAPRGAAITSSEDQAVLVRISGVPNVTLRGLTLRASGPRQTQVAVIGGAPGLVLERLDLDATAVKDCESIMFYGANHPDDLPPAVVRNCTIRGGKFAIGLRALSIPASTPLPFRGVILADNVILQPAVGGIGVMGKISDVHIVGNRIHGHPRLQAGLQFQELAGASDVLVANNSFLACRPALCVWDTAASGDGFEVVANLVLGALDNDFIFVDGNLSDPQPKGAGDTKRLCELWTFQGNWREVADQSADPKWISPGLHDERRDVIDVLSRLPGHVDFLRPAADSELAKKGAGGDLPSYVGAVAPERAETWDWQRTWTSRHP